MEFKVRFYLSEQAQYSHELYREIEWADGEVERLAVEASQADRNYWFYVRDNHECQGIEEVFI